MTNTNETDTLVQTLYDQIERLDSEIMEQCRINGMGAERELALMARVSELERANVRLRGALSAILDSVVEGNAAILCTLFDNGKSALAATENLE
jgi:hypothetical protein